LKEEMSGGNLEFTERFDKKRTLIYYLDQSFKLRLTDQSLLRILVGCAEFTKFVFGESHSLTVNQDLY